MRVRVMSGLTLLACLAALVGCGGSHSPDERQAPNVVVRFYWPNGGASSRLVPPETETIELTVTATDMATVTSSVNKSQVQNDEATLHVFVPSGTSRRFTARAKDASGAILAEGASTVDIVIGVGNQISIVMAPYAPQLAVSPTDLAFGVAGTIKTLQVTNGGEAPLTWACSVPSGADWITDVDAAGGELQAGASQVVTVAVCRAGLEAGTYSADLKITSNGGDATVHVTVSVAAGDIVFMSDRDGNWEIYVMDADGSGQHRLTNDPGVDEEPAWSPDGLMIAFDSSRSGAADIYVMNADGSAQTRLTENPLLDHHPQWLPDGTQIAFDSTRDGNYEIYRMNPDGSDQTNISHNFANDVAPDWSPDGTKIVFESTRDGQSEIYVMNADGSGQTRLTNNPACDEKPDWSPDGTRIVYTSDRDGNKEIYVMNADGTDQANLTNHPGYDRWPSWSADGSKVIFESQRDGNGEIYVMNADGSGQANLTHSPGNDSHPNWRP